MTQLQEEQYEALDERAIAELNKEYEKIADVRKARKVGNHTSYTAHFLLRVH